MNNIKKARESAGLSQKEVAVDLKVSTPTVSEWESGKKNPTAANLKALANLFHVPTDYLIGESDVPNTLGKDDDGKTIMIHSNEPISILFSQYDMTCVQFSEISGIPLPTVEFLSAVAEPISQNSNDHPKYAEVMQTITDDQWNHISNFFEIELCKLKDGFLPLWPNHSVQRKLNANSGMKYAAYNRNQLSKEEQNIIKKFLATTLDEIDSSIER